MPLAMAATPGDTDPSLAAPQADAERHAGHFALIMAFSVYILYPATLMSRPRKPVLRLGQDNLTRLFSSNPAGAPA